jgi:sterol 24-C-methyltransferase
MVRTLAFVAVVVVAVLVAMSPTCQLLGHAIKTLVLMENADYDAFVNSYDVFDDPQENKEDEAKVNAVYKVLVPLMELGALTKFYIPPLMDKTKPTFRDLPYNQEIMERKMADAMELVPGKVALDIGCGQGLVADMVQEQSGAKVVGINISPEQLAKARSNAASKGKLGTLLEFEQGSMNERLPFPDNSFDAAYIVQANAYAHNFTSLMGEVRRVLKPGGIFSDLAVCSLDKYDPNNKTHVQMAGEARRVGVIPVWRPRAYYLDGCTENGFSVRVSKNLGHHEMMQAATDFFNPLGGFIGLLHRIGLIEKEAMLSINRMNEHAQALIQGDRDGLFTTNYWIVAQAPR